ncbi:hypothetical protein L6164_006677 [Bauhinia variegata]|uniref:Uncharacterized protein n=1 Tax=Bauhinia variegata TaxID=167791 RepID=A0ACB9PUN2_BAUVA|nr:hypothetical protein L6164_006677 [Bauhinia variegata]
MLDLFATSYEEESNNKEKRNDAGNYTSNDADCGCVASFLLVLSGLPRDGWSWWKRVRVGTGKVITLGVAGSEYLKSI